MENAQLITLSRITALERQMNVVANNVANINTTGFKAQELLFEEYLSPTASAEEFEFTDRDVRFVLDYQSVSNFGDGPLQPTSNQLDVAIKGEGFFVVQTPNGERYTRDGSFTLDPQGQLVTSEGFLVQGDGGPIVFGPDDTDITITGEGAVSTQNGEIGRLQIVQFENNQELRRIGRNLYEGEDAQPLETPRLSQFALEGANVDPITGISRMIEIQRSYQELSNIMRQQNDLREQAIRELGRVEVNA